MAARTKTVVITGGSAGIGRATAGAFARRGWNIALIARSASGLEDARAELESLGASVLTIAGDVAESETIFAAARRVIERWERIDVWINNAMVTVISPVHQLLAEEVRRVHEVTYLGCVFGTMAALEHMRKENAGTIVQVGSALSYRAIPLQSAYCGAKFAVRGFTDALRSELRHEGSVIRLTMAQLPAVNTPQFDWARNRMLFRAQPVPPIHDARAIGEAIFRCALNGPRETWIGFSTVKAIVGTIIAPAILDRLLSRNGYDGQLTGEPQLSRYADNLFDPASEGHRTRGRFTARERRFVPVIDPLMVRVALALALLGIGATAFLAAFLIG